MNQCTPPQDNPDNCSDVLPLRDPLDLVHNCAEHHVPYTFGRVSIENKIEHDEAYHGPHVNFPADYLPPSSRCTIIFTGQQAPNGMWRLRLDDVAFHDDLPHSATVPKTQVEPGVPIIDGRLSATATLHGASSSSAPKAIGFGAPPNSVPSSSSSPLSHDPPIEPPLPPVTDKHTDIHGFDIVTTIPQSFFNSHFATLYNTVPDLFHEWAVKNSFTAVFRPMSLKLTSCGRVIIWVDIHRGSITTLLDWMCRDVRTPQKFENWQLAFEVGLQMRPHESLDESFSRKHNSFLGGIVGEHEDLSNCNFNYIYLDLQRTYGDIWIPVSLYSVSREKLIVYLLDEEWWVISALASLDSELPQRAIL